MRYSYKIAKHGNKKYEATSKDFPSLGGIGKTEDEAMDGLMTAVVGYIKECLSDETSIPEALETARDNTFGWALNMMMKMKLHNTRLACGVKRTELAHLLGLTYDDVKDGDWSLENLRTLIPCKKPKYKNVQRLFDLDHDSTVREVEQAYRVLGFAVHVTPYKR